MDAYTLMKLSRPVLVERFKPSGLRKTLIAVVGIACSSVIPSSDADAQDVIRTDHGDVFVISFSEYVAREENRIACGKLPRGTATKAFQVLHDQNFTAAEYQTLAGDAPYLGLRGVESWYSKAKRKYVSADELSEIYGSFGSGNWNRLPVLCGAETAQSDTRQSIANTIISWRNGESSCSGEFCDLSGGAYFHSIYENDIELIKRLDRSIDQTVKRKLGAILALSKDLGESPQDFSLLPALANAYLARRSQRICVAGLVKRTVTRRTETYDMFDAEGLYEGQGGGEVYRFTYRVAPELVQLCDSVCDARGGSSERSAVRSLGHRGATATLNGIDELVSGYSCSSSEVAQFEKNLAAMTKLYLDQKYDWNDAAPVGAQITQNSPQPSAAEHKVELERSRKEGTDYRDMNRAQGDVLETPSGLQFTILRRGDGQRPQPTDRVSIQGVGKLIDGRHMDDSYAAQPKTVTVSDLLPGLSEGIRLIRPGGKIRLILPPELGFGDRQVGMVKPGSTLIYELELISIVR